MKNDAFLGTYFEREQVLKLAVLAGSVSWVVLGLYFCQLLLAAGTFILQAARGFMAGLGFADVLQNVLYLLEQLVPGFVYFFALQGLGKALLMFLDIEQNTRRAARQANLREK